MSDPRQTEPSAWRRWGVAMARHRRAVLFAWAIALIVCAVLYPTLKKVLGAPNYAVDNSQSLQVERLLERSPHSGSEQDALVFYSPGQRAGDPAYRAVVARVVRATRAQKGVASVLGPYGTRAVSARISADRHSAIALVVLAGNGRQRFENVQGIQEAVARASGGGVRAWLTGFSPLARDTVQVESTDIGQAEGLGVPVAFVILLVALGALSAATIPLLLAGAGLLLTYGLIALLGMVFSLDFFLLTVVTMVGVGIGIDYSLFVVTRFREELARLPTTPRGERRRIAEAAGASIATSGRTIVYSGLVVGLSLTSLLAVHTALAREFVIGMLASVICTLAAALTLLPALLAQLGPRINSGSLPARLQPSNLRPGGGRGEGGWARWALAIMRRPIAVAALVSILLLVLMAPVLGIKYGLNVAFASLSGTPSGKGAEVLTRAFGPGLEGPVEVVVASGGSGAGAQASHVPAAALSRARGDARSLAARLRRDPRVAGIVLTPYAAGALLTVTPKVAVDSPAAYALVRYIRSDPVSTIQARGEPTVLVGGWTAQAVDASDETTGKLPTVLAITLGLALIFLLIAFRSVVLPVKAILMNLLATGATLGLVVLIFQDGHGEHVLGFSSPGFIQAFLPMFMFVLLFGLSMDYEVFLIRRMQEAWHETGDNRRAVAAGIEHTGRPISAAAAIMVAVFGSFLVANILELKQLGFALAAAVALDATLIRLALVPALMCLFGERNWWLPAGLARVLPRVDLD